MIKIAVIGYGYWGPNIVRNFDQIEDSKVVCVCDENPKAIGRALKSHKHIQTTGNSADIFHSPDVDAVAIITPVSTHFELAKTALLNGKHVFMEKPFTATSAQAEELMELAEKKKLVIMVDHTFIFTGAVRKMKQFLDGGILGDLYYYDSTRVNLGLFQKDVNVIWDLAPHDFAIMDYLIQEKPVALSVSGKSHVNGKEDTAYITAHFANEMIAHFNVSWLSPVKVRTTLISGEKRMLVWDDLEADEKLKVYDKGVDVKSGEGEYDLLINYRSGDVLAPRIDQTEALKLETEHFISCILSNKTPVNDGNAGLRVIKMLEACDKSLAMNGQVADIEIPIYF